MNINKPLWISSALGFLLPLSLSPTHAFALETEVLDYGTGFEPPTFVVGPLDGQDEWRNPPDTASICSKEIEPKCIAISGIQSIEAEGAKLNLIGGIFFTRFGYGARFPDFYDTKLQETPVIDTHVDARLDGPSTNTGKGKDDDLVSANFNGLGARKVEVDGVPVPVPVFLGNLVMSSSGDVWIMGSRSQDRYFTGVPINLKQSHRLGLRIDFAARMTSFFVDGDPVVDDEGGIVSLPFDSNITSNIFAFGALEVGAIQEIDRSRYRAYFDNYAEKAFMPVPFDVKPGSCPNPLNVKSRGVLPVAIVGTEDLDVADIDPESIRLSMTQGGEEIKSVRWSMEDVATPQEPYTGKENANSCNDLGPDGEVDLTLQFKTQDVVDKLGANNKQNTRLLTVTGYLKVESGGTPIIAEDVILLVGK